MGGNEHSLNVSSTQPPVASINKGGVQASGEERRASIIPKAIQQRKKKKNSQTGKAQENKQGCYSLHSGTATSFHTCCKEAGSRNLSTRHRHHNQCYPETSLSHRRCVCVCVCCYLSPCDREEGLRGRGDKFTAAFLTSITLSLSVSAAETQRGKNPNIFLQGRFEQFNYLRNGFSS